MHHHNAATVPPSIRLGGVHPLRFGKASRRLCRLAERLPTTLSDEARQFAAAYAAGFIAVSLFIA